MGESHRDSTHQNHHILLHSAPANSSYRLGIAKGGGEIVEVKGGHIVRSTSRKDRHSKVLTAKGPRDRRVRLSANTAIQFYDVQDRLGYDRPSKAVDWLIKNAKASIDELEKIPPWHPSTMADVSLQQQQPILSTQQQQPMLSTQQKQQEMMMNSDDAAAAETSDSTAYNNAFGGGGSTSTSFLPSPVQSEYSIADTIKSFFPTTGVTASSSNAPTGLYAQDLRLSLQSFQQDPILLHHHSHQNQQSNTTASEHPFFSSSSSSSHMPMVYDTIPLVPWHTAGGVEDDGGGGYGYNNFPSPQGMAAMHAGVGQNSFYPPQRGTLQSSDSPYIRAWMDPTLSTSTAGFSGFSRFRIPARIQGDLEEEEQGHDAVSDKPS